MGSVVGIVVGMATGVVASACLQAVLNAYGKSTEAQQVDATTRIALGVTAVGMFAKLAKTLLSLG